MDQFAWMLMLILFAPWAVAWAIDHPRPAHRGCAGAMTLFIAAAIVDTIRHGWPAPALHLDWTVIGVAVVGMVAEVTAGRMRVAQIVLSAVASGMGVTVVGSLYASVYYHTVKPAAVVDGLIVAATMIASGVGLAGLRKWRQGAAAGTGANAEHVR